MRKHKAIIVIAAVIVLAALAFGGWRLYLALNPEQPTVFERILNTFTAKFEKNGDGGVILIIDPFGLRNFVSEVILDESDIPVTDWIFRITFNNNESSPDTEEIVVLVGDQSLSIDGVNYTASDFNYVKDVIQSYYESYRESYQFLTYEELDEWCEMIGDLAKTQRAEGKK